jgi:hypothetical protein
VASATFFRVNQLQEDAEQPEETEISDFTCDIAYVSLVAWILNMI